MLHTGLAPLLSAVPFEELEALHLGQCEHSRVGDGEEETRLHGEWLARLSAPQLQTFTGKVYFPPNLFQALSYPGVAPRLETIALTCLRAHGHELPTAISRGGWPELSTLAISGLLPPSEVTTRMMEALKVAALGLRVLELWQGQDEDYDCS